MIRTKLVLGVLILVSFFCSIAEGETRIYWMEDRYNDSTDYLGRFIVEYDLETGTESSTQAPSDETRLIIPENTTTIEAVDDTNGIIYKYSDGTFKPVAVEPLLSHPDGYVFARIRNRFYYYNSNSIFTIDNNGTMSGLRFYSDDTYFQPIVARDKRMVMNEFTNLWGSPSIEQITEITIDDNGDNIIKTINLLPDEVIYRRYVFPMMEDAYLVFSCFPGTEDDNSVMNDTYLKVDRYYLNPSRHDMYKVDHLYTIPHLYIDEWSYTNSFNLLASLAIQEHSVGLELYYDAIILLDVNNGDFKVIKKYGYGPQQWVEDSYIIVCEM